MGSHVALVKGNRQMRFQVDRVTHFFWFWFNEVARWDLMMGFQVDRASTHSLVLKKEIARWDLKLTKERKKERRKKKRNI